MFMLTGCGHSWDRTFAVSEIKLEDDYIVGEIRNKTDLAYDVRLKFKLINGTITDEDTCSFIMRPHQTRKIHCASTNHENYEAELSDIKFKEIDIPKLKDGEIDASVVEYYFEDIYNEHIYNVIGFTFLDSSFSKEYPYINNAEYSKDDAELLLTTIFSNSDSNTYYISEKFNVNNKKMEYVSVMIFTNDFNKLLV